MDALGAPPEVSLEQVRRSSSSNAVPLLSGDAGRMTRLWQRERMGASRVLDGRDPAVLVMRLTRNHTAD